MASEDAERIYEGLHEIAFALHRLGTANAATEMGAIEVLANAIKEGLSEVAQAAAERANLLDDE